MRVLIITTNVPGFVTNGGEQWTRTIADSLRRIGCEVALLGFERPGNPPAAGEISVGKRVVETRSNPVRALGWGLEALLRGQPYTVAKWAARNYRRSLARKLGEENWDMAVIDHVQLSWARRQLGGIPFVHLSHHAEGELYGRQAEAGSAARRAMFRREAWLIARLERDLIAAAAETWCISNADREVLIQSAPTARIIALPSDCRHDWSAAATIAPNGPDLALIGNWRWGPNRQALCWFLDEVIPRLPASWRIEIAGAVDLRGLSQDGRVTFVGTVSDPCAFLRRAHRIAVPSLAEVGCNFKLLDGIAAGRPLVADRRAVGFVGPVPAHVYAVDGPVDFAEALRLAGEPNQADCTAWLQGRRARLDATIADSVSIIANRRFG